MRTIGLADGGSVPWMNSSWPGPHWLRTLLPSSEVDSISGWGPEG